MRVLWILCVSVVLLMLLVPAIGLADVPIPWPIKWSQPPNMLPGAPDYSSTITRYTEVDGISGLYPTLVADDFMCTQTGYIDSVHWWGSLIRGTTHPDWFVFGVYSYMEDDFSMPGEVLWSKPVYSNQYQLEFYGMAGQEEVWQYYVDMSDWGDARFWQQQGTYYFLAIGAGYDEVRDKEWGWHEAATQWNDDAVNFLLDSQGNLLGFEPIEREGLSRDMAFELDMVPEPGTLTLLGLGLAGLGARLRRKRG